MSEPIYELQLLLASMTPVLNEGIYFFATLTDENTSLPANAIIASIAEHEGLSVVVSDKTVAQYGLSAQFCSAWITLQVHSDLAAVGLTACFAKALADAGISCNVVAGNYHDHIFVPYDKKALAMRVLLDLQGSAQAASRDFGQASIE